MPNSLKYYQPILDLLGISAVLPLGVAVLLSFISPGEALAHDAPLKQAEALLEDGERDLAIDALTNVIRQNPKDARAYYLRASIRQRNGDKEMAIADLSEAVRLDSKGLRDYLQRGWAYGRTRDLDRAISRLTDASEFEPRRGVWCRSVRACFYLLKRDFNSAIADLDAVLRSQPKSFADHSKRAFAYFEKGNLDKAMADIAEAAHFAPKEPSSLMNMDIMRRGGYQLAILHDMDFAYLRSGDIDNALTEAQKVVHSAPQSAGAIAVRGHLWQRKGEHEKALADYLAAVRLEAADAHEPEVLNLGKVCSGNVADMSLPWTTWLNDENFRRRAHVTREQEKKLRTFSMHAMDAMHDEFGNFNPGAILAEQGDLDQRHKDFERLVAELLTPEQEKLGTKLVLNAMVPWVLAAPRSRLELYGFTPEQLDKLGQLAGELNRKTAGMEYRAADRFVALLSDRQRAKLRKEIAGLEKCVDGWAGWGNGRCLHVAGQTVFLYNLGASEEDPMKRFPAYNQLSRRMVREELGFTSTQEKQLAKIVPTDSSNGIKIPYRVLDSGDDPASGAKKEISRSKEVWEEMRRQLSHLLTPEQAARLKECTFRHEAFSRMGNFYTAEQLGLSERQKAAVEKICQEYREQEDTMNAQPLERLFGWLKPDQQNKLRRAMLEDEW